MEEKVMDNVSGGIWGSYPPRKERTMTKEMNSERAFEKAEVMEERYARRKMVYLNKIMGELEAFVEAPGEEWLAEQEIALLDILDYVNNAVKAQLSDNDPEYRG